MHESGMCEDGGRRKDEMGYRLERNESVPQGLRRIAREQLASAPDELGKRGSQRAEGIHEARKSIKKVLAVPDGRRRGHCSRPGVDLSRREKGTGAGARAAAAGELPRMAKTREGPLVPCPASRGPLERCDAGIRKESERPRNVARRRSQ